MALVPFGSTKARKGKSPGSSIGKMPNRQRGGTSQDRATSIGSGSMPADPGTPHVDPTIVVETYMPGPAPRDKAPRQVKGRRAR